MIACAGPQDNDIFSGDNLRSGDHPSDAYARHRNWKVNSMDTVRHPAIELAHADVCLSRLRPPAPRIMNGTRTSLPLQNFDAYASKFCRDSG